MTLKEIKNLDDETPIDEVVFQVTKLGNHKPATKPGWASEWFVNIKDAEGTMLSAIFKLKKNTYDPATLVGKTVKFVTGQDKDGNKTGIKVKLNGQWKNVYITDSAKMSIVGSTSAASSPSPSGSGGSATNHRATPPPLVGLSPEDIAKHLATEWVQVYDWTHEIFETRLKPEQIREVVTGIIIEMRRLPITILPTTDRKINWKDFVFRDTRLGDLDQAKLMNGYVFCLQGKLKTPEVVMAFEAAFKDMGFDHRSVYGHWLNKEGIEDDTADTILLRHMTTTDDMKDGDYQAILSKPELFEEMKQLQASKHTAFDDQEVNLD